MLLTELYQCDIMVLKGSSISATLRRTMFMFILRRIVLLKKQKTIKLPFWHLKGPNKCDIRLVQT